MWDLAWNWTRNKSAYRRNFKRIFRGTSEISWIQLIIKTIFSKTKCVCQAFCCGLFHSRGTDFPDKKLSPPQEDSYPLPLVVSNASCCCYGFKVWKRWVLLFFNNADLFRSLMSTDMLQHQKTRYQSTCARKAFLFRAFHIWGVNCSRCIVEILF